jgi:hypothetical protein
MERDPLTEKELDRLKEILPESSFEFYQEQFGNQLNLFPEATKLIDCPLELSINVTISVLEQDSEGKNIGSHGLKDYTYHMPVPTGQDHEEYIVSFLEHLEKSMIEANTAAEKVKNEQ